MLETRYGVVSKVIYLVLTAAGDVLYLCTAVSLPVLWCRLLPLYSVKYSAVYYFLNHYPSQHSYPGIKKQNHK